MKNKSKQSNFKKYIIGFIIGSIFFGTISFAAGGTIGELFNLISGNENGVSVTDEYRLNGGNIQDGTITEYELESGIMPPTCTGTGFLQFESGNWKCSTPESTSSCDSGYSLISGECEPNTWSTGTWSSCSATAVRVTGSRGSCSVPCGPGTKYRSVTCPSKTGTQTRTVECTNISGDVIDDSLCVAVKPVTSTSCTDTVCNASKPATSTSCNNRGCTRSSEISGGSCNSGTAVTPGSACSPYNRIHRSYIKTCAYQRCN